MMADGSGSMADNVNVMIVSDHGMMRSENLINITKIVNNSNIITFDDIEFFLLNSLNYSGMGLVWPTPGKEKEVK